MPDRSQLRCTECERLAREFQDAWQADQQDLRAHFHETAEAAGREPEIFLQQWVISLAQMPDNEFDSLQRAHYPRGGEVLRNWQEHGTLSGHSGPGNNWRRAFIFDTVVRSGYYGFLKGSGLR